MKFEFDDVRILATCCVHFTSIFNEVSSLFLSPWPLVKTCFIYDKLTQRFFNVRDVMKFEFDDVRILAE